MSRRTARDTTSRANTRRLFGDDTETHESVRPSDLIRAQRPREAAWTVFIDSVDAEEEQPKPCRRAQRNNLVRQRPTAWKVVENVDEHDKENVGYVVKRPTRRPLESSSPVANTPATPDRTANPASPAPTPRSNGKRKLQTTPSPPPKKTKIATKQKKDLVEVRPEQAATRQERVRRPLEDITHLFVDPTAFYFQPWRRATRIAPRAASMRIL